MKFRYDDDKKALVISEAEPLEYNQIKIWLERYVNGYKFMPAFKRKIWDGKIRFFNNGVINMGLWKECVKACYEIGAPFIIENKEEFPINREVTLEKVQSFCDDFFKDHKIEDKDGNKVPFVPYDYQVETAFKILKNRYCIGEVATSGGKSLILSIVFFYILRNIKKDAKLLLVVPSINLVTQFYDNIMEYNLGFFEENTNPIDVRIEEIMSDKPRKYSGTEDPNIFIACYQSLSKEENKKKKAVTPREIAQEKYLKSMEKANVNKTKKGKDNLTRPDSWFEQFHTVAIDEAHSCKSKSLITVAEKTFKSAYYRFGVSGTFPSDESAEGLTVQSILGPKVASIKAKMLQEKGKIASVSIKGIYINHNDEDFDMLLRTIRKNPNRGREAYELEKKYVQNSEPRLKFISKLIDKCESNTLILFNQIDYGTKLFEHLKEEFDDKKEFYYIDGSVPGKKREVIIKKMEESGDVPKILVASFGTLSTGISIKNLHNLILSESFKSEVRIIQSLGRLLRLHSEKDKANIFDLVDVFTDENQVNTFARHFKERCTLYKKHQYPYKIMRFNL